MVVATSLLRTIHHLKRGARAGGAVARARASLCFPRPRARHRCILLATILQTRCPSRRSGRARSPRSRARPSRAATRSTLSASDVTRESKRGCFGWRHCAGAEAVDGADEATRAPLAGRDDARTRSTLRPPRARPLSHLRWRRLAPRGEQGVSERGRGGGVRGRQVPSLARQAARSWVAGARARPGERRPAGLQAAGHARSAARPLHASTRPWW